MTIETLNQRHAIADVLTFHTGMDDQPIAKIHNATATAEICLYGGHVLRYKPHRETEDVIFLSDLATCANGKAIRGGIPICWPWFGADPDGLGRPNHGFVRNRLWQTIATEAIDSGTTKLTLGLSDTDDTRAIWPHRFDLAIAMTVGPTLTVELTTHNTGNTPFTLTQALHTYFTVGDINRVRVRGLEGKYYLDKVDSDARKFQTEAIAIAGEVDRIYFDVPAVLTIDDPALDRSIRTTSSGNTTAVVWNPWIEKAAAMGDLGDADYQQMICVETTNAASDVITVEPGETFCLSAIYQVQSNS
jgi:glucose-6-phosphate 1-epimerase